MIHRPVIVSKIYIYRNGTKETSPSPPFEIRNVKRHLGRHFCTVSFHSRIECVSTTVRKHWINPILTRNAWEKTNGTERNGTERNGTKRNGIERNGTGRRLCCRFIDQRFYNTRRDDSVAMTSDYGSSITS